MNEVWKLCVLFDNGASVSIHGTEEVLRIVHDEWVSWLRMSEVEQESEVDQTTVEGICDSPDRATCVLTFLKSSVVSMTVLQAYS